MKDRNDQIIDAAVGVFMRYGVKRATMNDIAEAAGVVRQTLYNQFSNKDDILRAAIRLGTRRSCTEIRQRAEALTSLADRLDLVFEVVVLKPHALLSQSPNAADIVEGLNATSRTELAEAEQAYAELLAEMLAPYQAQLDASGLNRGDFAAFVIRSAKASKRDVGDAAALSARLDVLRQVVLVVTGQAR